MSTNYDEYNEFLKDADKDNRVGDHDFMVSSVTEDSWPSGDPRIKIKGVLLTANSAQADLTLSPPPPAATIKEKSKSWTGGKKKAIAQAIAMYRELAESYGVEPQGLKEGDVLRVKTVKTRIDPETGSGGFIRIAVIKPKGEVGKTSAEVGASTANVPF